MANSNRSGKAKKAITVIAVILAIAIAAVTCLQIFGKGKIKPSEWFTKTVYVPGVPGTDGKDGADGVTPHIGDNGNWFIGETDTGIKAKGTDGADGRDGAPGADGKDGVNGANGADGKDGVNGADGVTPHIGDNGNWFIGETDTGVQASASSNTSSITYSTKTNSRSYSLSTTPLTDTVTPISDSLYRHLYQSSQGWSFELLLGVAVPALPKDSPEIFMQLMNEGKLGKVPAHGISVSTNSINFFQTVRFTSSTSINLEWITVSLTAL